MAEIPIKKKSGIPGWLWFLLAAIILALLAWWILDNDGDDVVEYTDESAEVVVADPAMDGVEPFVVGEAVTLSAAEVTELTGDMSFTINSEGREAFVVFNQEPTPNQPTEGEFDINPGQLVNITGTVMSADAAMPDGVDATVPTGMTQYIFADSMEVVDRPAN
ncbi:MAG: hypothetical protein WA948_05475 [Pontixanthobacter sp.]